MSESQKEQAWIDKTVKSMQQGGNSGPTSTTPVNTTPVTGKASEASPPAAAPTFPKAEKEWIDKTVKSMQQG